MSEDDSNARQITISEPDETDETTTTGNPPAWDMFAEPIQVGDHVQAQADGALHHAEIAELIDAGGYYRVLLATGLEANDHDILKVPQDHEPDVAIPVLHTREDADAYYNPPTPKRPRESGPAHAHSTRRTTRTSSSRRK